MSGDSNKLPAETALSAGENAELGELQLQMRDTREWFQPTNQAARDRHLALLEKQDGEPQTTHPPSPLGKRKQEIEMLMRDTHSAYWKGPQAQSLQLEYQRLLDGKETPEADTALWSEALDISEAEVKNAHANALAVEEALPDTVGDIEASIAGLSGDTQDLIRVILADPGSQSIPFTDESAAELRDWFGRMPADEQQAIRDVLGVAF